MTNPERLEKALPELLVRTGWTGPEQCGTSPPLSATEQAQWEGLFAEPVQNRPFGSMGFTGLAAAGVAMAVGMGAFLGDGALRRPLAPGMTTADIALVALGPGERGVPLSAVLPPHPARPIAPEYPRIALRRGWQGRAVILAHITVTGTVESPSVSNTSGHRELDTAAVAAVRKARFSPARRSNGTAVGSWIKVPIRFELGDRLPVR